MASPYSYLPSPWISPSSYNHGAGTMELRLDPLSSSFNPYFYVIIGSRRTKPVDGHLALQQVSLQWIKADLQDYFRFISSFHHLLVQLHLLQDGKWAFLSNLLTHGQVANEVGPLPRREFLGLTDRYLSVDFQVLEALLSRLSSWINFDDWSDFLIAPRRRSDSLEARFNMQMRLFRQN